MPAIARGFVAPGLRDKYEITPDGMRLSATKFIRHLDSAARSQRVILARTPRTSLRHGSRLLRHRLERVRCRLGVALLHERPSRSAQAAATAVFGLLAKSGLVSKPSKARRKMNSRPLLPSCGCWSEKAERLGTPRRTTTEGCPLCFGACEPSRKTGSCVRRWAASDAVKAVLYAQAPSKCRSA